MAWITVVILAGLALLHFYWASGGTWPGEDRTDLARKVADRESFPSAGATYTVMILLVLAALLVGAKGELWSIGIDPALTTLGTWGVFVVLVARGVVGMVYSYTRLRKGIRHPFLRPNLLYYSPLTLFLAVGVLTVLI